MVDFFSPHHRIQTGSGADPDSYPMGTGSPYFWDKAAGECRWPLPSSAEIKNAWSYTSTPQYVFMAWCLVKHRDNFTFTKKLLQQKTQILLKSLYHKEILGPYNE
jgi:hypothetical protein